MRFANFEQNQSEASLSLGVFRYCGEPGGTAGLDVSDGIVVEALFRTSDPDIFAAGDVANVSCPALQQRLRIEQEDDAAAMGRIAGLNMAGRSESYSHLPYLYSDLFGLGYEAVGETDSRLEIVADLGNEVPQGRYL